MIFAYLLRLVGLSPVPSPPGPVYYLVSDAGERANYYPFRSRADALAMLPVLERQNGCKLSVIECEE